jgi:hypothetical protein
VTGPVDDYAYPIVWWGVLLLVDVWNWKRHGLSMWRSDGRHFLMVTAPVSVLVWLFFEALNLAAPQWRYHSRVTEAWKLVPLGFASFSTVIPIVVEAWWLFGGGRCLPSWPASWLFSHARIAFAIAALLTLVPLVNRVFWLNQGMWLVPAFALAAFTASPKLWSGARALYALTGAGLLAGFAWEAFNYPSPTGWHYTILPEVPRLFQMPLPGYGGFVPFAFAMLVVYHWQRKLVPGMVQTLAMYAVALAGLYVLTVLYARHGLWVFQ